MRICVGLVFGLLLALTQSQWAFAQGGTDEDGFPTRYLVAGPYRNVGGAAPGEAAIMADYLCDGVTDEDSIEPLEGLPLNSPDPECAALESALLGACGAARIRVHSATNTTLDLNARLFPNDNTVAYMWVWVVNLTDDDVFGTIGFASDDSAEVKVNGESLFTVNAGRGAGGPGVIQNDGIPVFLEPGPNLVQLKVFEGGGGWGARLRLLDEFGAPITDDGESFRVTLNPFESSRFRRQITDEGDVVSVSVEGPDEAYSLVESFDPRWVVANVSAGGVISPGSIFWGGATGTVSYTLVRLDKCSDAQSVIDGQLETEGLLPVAVGGDSAIPGCEGEAFISELLVTPAYAYDSGVNICALANSQVLGPWIDGDDFTDRDYVPEDGLVFAVNFENTPLSGHAVIGELAKSEFWSDPANHASESKVTAVSSTGPNGVFDWQQASTYEIGVDRAMNVASFYVTHHGDEPECVWLAFGSDDSAIVRVNGFFVGTHIGCRGHGGFTNRIRISLDPGKNLVSLYTFENTGGFTSCLRFENEVGASIFRDTTLDPTGYDPNDHEAPPEECIGGSRDSHQVSALGFVTSFLVPDRVFAQSHLASPPAGAKPLDYIAVLDEAGEPQEASIDNLREGAFVGPGTGLISERVQLRFEDDSDDSVRLTVFENRNFGDPGLFNAELFYSHRDNLSTTGFFFLENHTDAPLGARFSFASDDGAHLFVNGELIGEHLTGRGFGNGDTTQNGPYEVVLPPGLSLAQMSLVEGGGGSGFRVRVQPSCGGGTVFAEDELSITSTRPSDAKGGAERSVVVEEGDELRVDVSLTIAEETQGVATIRERIPSDWELVDLPAGAEFENGVLSWSGASAETLTYQMLGSCKGDVVEISGEVDLADGRSLIVRGDRSVDQCRRVSFVPNLLLAPAFSTFSGCNPSVAEIEQTWFEDGTGIEMDRGIVPEEGLEFAPDFGGLSLATGMHPVLSFEAQERFWSEAGNVLSSPRLAAVSHTAANGLFDFQAGEIFGNDINDAMVVGFFYAINESDEPRTVSMGFGSDDSGGVRVNGYQAFAITACRGHPAFSDKFAVTLSPGKNLISVYVWEGGGGFNMCIRFEDAGGSPLFIPTTLDPDGYDPDDHERPEVGVDPISPQGFVKRFLVPSAPLEFNGDAFSVGGASPEDYIFIDDEVPSMDNVRLGASVTEGSGVVTTGVASLDRTAELEVVQLGFGDPVFNGDAYYGNIPDAYSSTGFFYLNNLGQSRSAWLGFASDDSAHLYINGSLVHEFVGGRGFGPPNVIQNGPFEVELEPGANLVQLSYVDGGGGSGFRVGVWANAERSALFSDEEVRVCIDPEAESCGGQPVGGPRFLRGDTDNSGNLALTDAISILGFLFLGASEPICIEAGDTDDNGSLNLTDGVYLLTFLFLGGQEPPAPYPNCAVVEDDGDPLSCRTSHSCR